MGKLQVCAPTLLGLEFMLPALAGFLVQDTKVTLHVMLPDRPDQGLSGKQSATI